MPLIFSCAPEAPDSGGDDPGSREDDPDINSPYVNMNSWEDFSFWDEYPSSYWTTISTYTGERKDFRNILLLRQDFMMEIPAITSNVGMGKILLQIPLGAVILKVFYKEGNPVSIDCLKEFENSSSGNLTQIAKMTRYLY